MLIIRVEQGACVSSKSVDCGKKNLVFKIRPQIEDFCRYICTVLYINIAIYYENM